MMRSLPRHKFVLLVLALIGAISACGDDTIAGPLLDPTETSEQRPVDYRESLPRDAITPIYDPEFVASSEIDWSDDELVIGVEFDGDARAYPVGLLTWREIVIDDHRGIPTMVTW